MSLEIVPYSEKFKTDYEKTYVETFKKSQYADVGFLLHTKIQYPENEDKCLLAVENDKVIGFVVFGREKKIFNNQHAISLIGVLSDYRGKKIGKKLLEKAEEQLEKDNVKEVNAIYPIADTDINKFFTRANYQPQEVLFDVEYGDNMIPKLKWKQIWDKKEKIDYFIPWLVVKKEL
ncbi:MAG: GNAT family N-acetyltransferase [Candidatus Diapherotrites archaeon]|nr:GNAT family N-acetyltransferase [Candidatus Diapherotrites archaeon]